MPAITSIPILACRTASASVRLRLMQLELTLMGIPDDKIAEILTREGHHSPNCEEKVLPISKHSEHMPLNRQAEVMARHGVPIDRTVLSDWMGRTGSEIAPVVDHMAKRLLWESTRLDVDETTVPVLDPGRGKTKTGYLWAVLRDDRGWNGSAPPGVVFHYRPGRKGEYAAEILSGFNGTIRSAEAPDSSRMVTAPATISGRV